MDALQEIQQSRFVQYALLSVIITLSYTMEMLKSVYIKVLYHNSILTGEGWVMELLAGHPEHICYFHEEE
jgi:general stress protein CsbA